MDGWEIIWVFVFFILGWILQAHAGISHARALVSELLGIQKEDVPENPRSLKGPYLERLKKLEAETGVNCGCARGRYVAGGSVEDHKEMLRLSEKLRKIAELQRYLSQ